MTQKEASRGPCPYCRKSEPEVSYIGREHVVPQGFGGFKPALIAWNVCDHCNDFFGKNHDRILQRGTYEGVMRPLFPITASKKVGWLGKDSRFAVQIPEGPFKGMYVLPVVKFEKGTFPTVFLKQVGLRSSPEEDFDFYLAHQVPSHDECITKYGKNAMACLAGFDTQEEGQELLRDLGYNADGIDRTTDIVPGQRLSDCVVQTYKVDDMVMRSVAKIALNYLVLGIGSPTRVFADV